MVRRGSHSLDENGCSIRRHGIHRDHLTQHLLRQNLAESIVLVDLQQPRDLPYARCFSKGWSPAVGLCRARRANADSARLLPDQADLVFNLAAVHREPGHLPVSISRPICQVRRMSVPGPQLGLRDVVFTSSISPTAPPKSVGRRPRFNSCNCLRKFKVGGGENPCGLAGAETGRKLLISSGVVFGPGEGGNVTRLVRSLVKGYFVYLAIARR